MLTRTKSSRLKRCCTYETAFIAGIRQVKTTRDLMTIANHVSFNFIVLPFIKTNYVGYRAVFVSLSLSGNKTGAFKHRKAVSFKISLYSDCQQ